MAPPRPRPTRRRRSERGTSRNEFARSNRHNLAVVRGTDAIQRVLKLTGVEEMLVLADDPDDLVPPPVTH